MMGLGYLGSSSTSSSSSNLSPLAPPFTVDRSNHNKPVLKSNPISQFNDPSYGVPFTSSWPYSHSSTARQEFSADSTRTTALPSNDCGYMISEPVNLPTTGNWSGMNSNGKHGLEQITPARSHWSSVYPSPKRVTDSFSYNLSESKPFYPPYASSANNDDVPLVSFSEPSYDLLSTSGLVHGDETSQVDYTRSLSGLEYNPQQDGLWTGLPEGKQVKKLESDDSFFSEKAPIAASLAYNNYLNQGAYGTETLSKNKDDSSLFYYADIIKKANNIGPSMNGKSDATSFSANNHRLDPNDFSKGGSTFRAFPMFSESHPLIQSPEDPWNSQMSYTPYEKRYHMFDCSDDHMSTSITKSSALIIKPPPAVSTYSAQKSYEIGNLSALNINDVVGSHKPLKEQEQSSGSFLVPNQLSFQIGRTDVPPSSTKEDMSTKLSANDQLNFEFKARSSFQVPEISIPNVNITENLKSSSNSFEQFDHHNPAEDSPCWKGAPTSQFLPFESTEADSPQPPMKKLQTGNGVDLQGSQTDYSFKNSSGIHEISGTDDRTPGHILVGKQNTIEVVDVGENFLKASNEGGVQSVDDTMKPKKGHGSSTSDANSQTPKLKLPNPEVEVMKIQLLYGDVDVNDAKNVNASILVKSLYTLSDLLVLHCSNDKFALKQHDHETLDHVIGNLGMCMSREVQVASTHKTMMPQQNTSEMSQEVAYGGKPQVMNADSGEIDQKPKSDTFSKNVEKLVEHASLRVEADPHKDDNMVQAIKKVLDENVECKVEVPLLYKNLWLEAEAELCSLSFRSRFERLKREMSDKSTSTDASAIKEISSCKVSTDPKIHLKVEGSKVCSPHIDDVEASVMARFNILKRREEPISANVEDQEVAGVKDSNTQIDDVMARFSILKRREEPNSVSVEDQEVAGKGSQGSEITVVGKDVEAWVMDRLNILKCRGDVEKKEGGKEEGHFHDEGEDEEEEEAVGSGGSDWEHVLKDEFGWRLS